MALTAKQMIQLALGLLSLANWITRKIDQAELKKQWAAEQFANQMQALNEALGMVDKAVQQSKDMTPEERRKVLKDD